MIITRYEKNVYIQEVAETDGCLAELGGEVQSCDGDFLIIIGCDESVM